jgi:hypothetical protein
MNLLKLKNIIGYISNHLMWMRCYLPVVMILLQACSGKELVFTETGREPHLIPDYTGITLPLNIAPLNFTINEKAEKFLVKFHSPKADILFVSSNDSTICIPSGKWKKLLEQCKGNELYIEIFTKRDGQWFKFSTITNRVANEPIDSYLVYRLIEPAFETWDVMSINQRCLENFNETPIMLNEMSDKNCMNCHSFCLNNSRTMLFHMRGQHAGTIIYSNGNLTKVNTKTSQTITPGVYPAWHPGGRFVAFSVNKIMQRFHAIPDKKIEVQDTVSDLILYDVETNQVSTSPAISSKERLETFPSWSPDGQYLYYCSARALPINEYNHIRYDLLRIAFDSSSKQFGAVDTILSATQTKQSVSFPRISPDGKYVLFCLSNYGNFTIWHKETDLYLLNLETGELSKPDINSTQTESYHTWSSNGRWLVFSSRRIDGLFTRPYFAYFDTSGKAHKPFVLPQKNPGFYDTFLKSYNIPELVVSAVDINPRTLLDIVNSEAINTSFESIK